MNHVLDPALIRDESLAAMIGAAILALWALSAEEKERTEVIKESRPGTITIRIRRSDGTIERAQVTDGALFGRGRDCTVVFDDSGVSKWHARLHCGIDRATIEDLNSTNGTLLNGRRIEGIAAVRRGDRIGLGANQIVFESIAPQKTRAIDV